MADEPALTAPAVADAPPSTLRMVLYGLLFALLIILSGLVLGARKQLAGAAPFPGTNNANVIFINPRGK